MAKPVEIAKKVVKKALSQARGKAEHRKFLDTVRSKQNRKGKKKTQQPRRSGTGN